MPLKISLKPNEQLYVNGAIMRNGNRSATFLFENTVRFLRESDVLRESEADTPIKTLYVTLTVIYLEDGMSAAIELFYQQATEIVKAEPAYAEGILAIRDKIEERQFYKALKVCKRLIADGPSPVAADQPMPAMAVESDGPLDLDGAREATLAHLRTVVAPGGSQDIYGEMEGFLAGLTKAGRISHDDQIELENLFNDIDLRKALQPRALRIATAIKDAAALSRL